MHKKAEGRSISPTNRAHFPVHIVTNLSIKNQIQEKLSKVVLFLARHGPTLTPPNALWDLTIFTVLLSVPFMVC